MTLVPAVTLREWYVHIFYVDNTKRTITMNMWNYFSYARDTGL